MYEIVKEQAETIAILSEALLKMVRMYEEEYDAVIPVERPDWLKKALALADPIDWLNAREELED